MATTTIMTDEAYNDDVAVDTKLEALNPKSYPEDLSDEHVQDGKLVMTW